MTTPLPRFGIGTVCKVKNCDSLLVPDELRRWV